MRWCPRLARSSASARPTTTATAAAPPSARGLRLPGTSLTSHSTALAPCMGQACPITRALSTEVVPDGEMSTGQICIAVPASCCSWKMRRRAPTTRVNFPRWTVDHRPHTRSSPGVRVRAATKVHRVSSRRQQNIFRRR